MKQKGFVLVSVLIITSITTMLAFSQIKENLLQERIGGNQQKEINARLAAEQGIIAVFKYINDLNQGGESNTAIITALTDDLNNKTALQGEHYIIKIDEVISGTTSTYRLISQGSHLGAVAYLKTEIETIEESGFFKDAVVACEGVTVGGSSTIDSYKGGTYSDATKTNNGDVKVIDGELSLGSGNDNNSSNSSNNSSNNSSDNGNKGIYGNVAAKTIVGDRDFIKGDEDPVEGYVGNSDECDPAVIASVMPTYVGTPASFAAGNGTTTTFDGINSAGGVSLLTMNTLEGMKPVYAFDNFSSTNNNNVIEISGEVIFYIKGNMTIRNTTFSLANSNSSLTIYIDGNIEVNTGSNVFANGYVNNGITPLTVYSSNSDDTAVTLGGNGQIYMNLYAPNETVSYNGTGAILGALRGKSIDISGNGSLHYDEGLGEVGSSTDPKSSYKAVYYSYE